MKLELEQDGDYWNVIDEQGRALAFKTVSLALAYIHQEEQEDLRKSRHISLDLTVGQLEFLEKALKYFPYGYADDDTKKVAEEVNWTVRDRIREENAKTARKNTSKIA